MQQSATAIHCRGERRSLNMTRRVDVVTERCFHDMVYVNGKYVRPPVGRDDDGGGNQVAQRALVLEQRGEVPMGDEADDGGEREAPDDALRRDLERVDMVEQLPV